ncbi:MAG: SPOR domain-containing protein [Wenzhouxiangellaceae bacterium]|nr:SPOR domain-containing protein [Wenzhouxiangellaceae bacterium]
MDKVLKRRLIGASIIIALAVIFVPMLLVDPDAVDGSGARDVDVPPIPDSAREVRRIPLDPEAARVPEAEVRAAPEARGAEPDSARGVPEGSASEPEPAAGTLDDEIVLRPELQRAAPEAGPAEVAAPSESEEESGAAPEPESEPAATPAADEEPPAAGAQADTLGDWVVQVASFGARESADSVARRLESLGHIVMRDELVRGQSVLFRLRTGPYPSRAAAERAREQITATVAGVEPIVRSVDDTDAGLEPGFVVQVGSFVSEKNAESETGRLSGLGFDAFRFSEEVGGRPIWRVVVGPVETREAADRLKARLTEQAGVEGLVVSHP